MSVFCENSHGSGLSVLSASSCPGWTCCCLSRSSHSLASMWWCSQMSSTPSYNFLLSSSSSSLPLHLLSTQFFKIRLFFSFSFRVFGDSVHVSKLIHFLFLLCKWRNFSRFCVALSDRTCYCKFLKINSLTTFSGWGKTTWGKETCWWTNP